MKLLPLPSALASMLALALSASPAASQAGDLPPWVRPDPTGQVVELNLTVDRPAGAASAVINGHARGSTQIVVPRGWTIRWNWVNADSSSHHSLVVMAEREKLPTEGGTAAFTNAMSRSLRAGIAPGGKDVSSFLAEDAGWYWMLCGVPGHAIAGEYLGLRVDPAASEVSVKQK